MKQTAMTVDEHKARTARSYKLMLLFAMISMTMLFAGLTSAFVVSKSRADWLKDFELPSAFLISTAVIIACSVTFHLSKKSHSERQQKCYNFFSFSNISIRDFVCNITICGIWTSSRCWILFYRKRKYYYNNFPLRDSNYPFSSLIWRIDFAINYYL